MSLIGNLRALLILTALLVFDSAAMASRGASVPKPAQHTPQDQIQTHGQALSALNQGRIDDATAILRARLAAEPHDAVAHQLLCRAFYSIELADSAIPECEAAVADAPADSNNSLWLGRAYGLRASRANPINAFRTARKVVAAFEHAVAINPANAPALSDLGEFYVSAPAIVGGGLDKAQELSARIMAVSPTRAHRLLAFIAEKKGDAGTAEAEFMKAVEAQPSPDSYNDLAAFYQRQKKNAQCAAAIQAAIRLDRAKDGAVVDSASILTDATILPQLAQQLLISYLASGVKSDSAPAAKVHVQLGRLLLASANPTAARQEFRDALSIASAYVPAQEALHTLEPAPAR